MLKMFPELKNNSLLFGGVLLVCFLVSAGVRYQQFETWKRTPAAYFVGERPMMTTLDAPYWLRWAREYNEVTYRQQKDEASDVHIDPTPRETIVRYRIDGVLQQVTVFPQIGRAHV